MSICHVHVYCVSGLGLRLAIKRSRVRLLIGARPCNDSGQVVHAVVSLSPSSIIWYQSMGSDAVRLGSNKVKVWRRTGRALQS